MDSSSSVPEIPQEHGGQIFHPLPLSSDLDLAETKMPASDPTEAKRKRVELTIGEKVEVLSELSAKISYRKIAGRFGISVSTVKNISANREKLQSAVIQNSNLSSKRLRRGTKCETVNQIMLEFARRCQEREISLTGILLQSRAKYVADAVRLEEFSASNGWLRAFKTLLMENYIHLKKLTAEAAEANLVVVDEIMKAVLLQHKHHAPQVTFDEATKALRTLERYAQQTGSASFPLIVTIGETFTKEKRRANAKLSRTKRRPQMSLDDFRTPTL